MQSKMQRLHLSFIGKLWKLKFMQELLIKIIIYLVVVAISIAIITTSPIFGRLIIVAIIVFWLIPTLIQKIADIKNYVDKE